MRKTVKMNWCKGHEASYFIVFINMIRVYAYVCGGVCVCVWVFVYVNKYGFACAVPYLDKAFPSVWSSFDS